MAGPATGPTSRIELGDRASMDRAAPGRAARPTGAPGHLMPLVAFVPQSHEFAGNRLFGTGGPLDRDGSLEPWRELKLALAVRGFDSATSDMIGNTPAVWVHLDASGPLPPQPRPETTVV